MFGNYFDRFRFESPPALVSFRVAAIVGFVSSPTVAAVLLNVNAVPIYRPVIG